MCLRIHEGHMSKIRENKRTIPWTSNKDIIAIYEQQIKNLKQQNI